MRQILVCWRSVFTLLIDVGDCKSGPQFVPALFLCLYNVTLSSIHKEVESVSLLLKVGYLWLDMPVEYWKEGCANSSLGLQKPHRLFLFLTTLPLLC